MTEPTPPAAGAGVFATGDELTGISDRFTGRVFLTEGIGLGESPVMVANVTFEPACRNNWHVHQGGQILIATTGRGWHQIDGEEPQELHAGDIVQVGPGQRHWHGAAKDSWFAHLAIEIHPQNGPVDWQERVEGYDDLP